MTKDDTKAGNVEQEIENIKQRYRDGEIDETTMEFELEQALGEDVDTSVSHDEIKEYEARTGKIHPVFHVDHKPTRQQPEDST